jgi:hypothetical protein
MHNPLGFTGLLLFLFLPNKKNHQPPMSKSAIVGKIIFDKRCIECHKPKIIDAYTLQKWDRILPRMSRKAKLNDQEYTELQSFIHYKLGEK